jgi:mannose-6-phosphate isomerase-like protein (cupin superfamily)
VVAGRLDVVRFAGVGVDRRDLLEPGQLVVVPPEVFHRFEAVTDGEALELYFPAEVNEHDIVRISEGFMTQ